MRLTVGFDGTPYYDIIVDLAALLDSQDGKAWVGFMGGSGWCAETHDVYTWNFDSTPVPEPSTLIAGALLAGPLGLQAIRRFRRNSFRQYTVAHE